MKNQVKRAKSSMLSGMLVIAALALPSSAFAMCSGAAVMQLNHNVAKCGGKGAFQTDKSSLFICASDDLQMRMVTSAFLSGRTISFTLDSFSSGNHCAPANQSSYGAKPTDLYVNKFLKSRV